MTTIRFAVICAALFMAGCTTCYHKPDAPKGQFDADMADCKAKKVAAGAGGGVSLSGRDPFIEACMAEKGWTAEHR